MKDLLQRIFDSLEAKKAAAVTEHESSTNETGLSAIPSAQFYLGEAVGYAVAMALIEGAMTGGEG